MSLYPIRPSFAAGVLAPALHKRTDLNQYYLGLRTGSNVIVLPQGGVVNRPGFEYIGTVKDSSKEVRVVPFEFSTTQAYVLEFGDYYMRVFKDGGQVVHTTSTTSAWATATGYVVADFVKNDDVIYRCISAHTSGATTEPGTGESWEDKWVADAAYEIATPWPESVLFDLRFQQSADTLYVFHPSYDTRTITRSAHTTWTLDTFDWENGPFMKDNDDDSHTLTVSAYSPDSTGLYGETVTVTSSADVFTANDVGRWLKIGYTDPGTLINDGEYDPSVPGYIGGPWDVDGKFELLYMFSDSSDGSVSLRYSVDGGTTYQDYMTFSARTGTAKLTVTGELRSEDYNHVTPKLRFYANRGNTPRFYWNLKKVREARTGYLKITAYTSAKEVIAKVYRRCSNLGIPTTNWALGAWGTTPGWPSSVTFHQGRLVFAGTTSEPSKVWMSVSDDYPNYDTGEGDEDSDAVGLTPIASEVNNVMWMASKGNLLIGTAGDEWVFDGANITPTNPPHARRETNFGSAKWQAVIANGYVVFVQDGEKIVRQVQYDYYSDTYFAIDLTAMSDHITGDGISYLAYLKSPWSTIWTCRDDGELIGLTYVPEHKVFAWHRHDLGGDVESVACIPGEIWVVVKRTINSATVRYIERILPWDGTLNNSVFMDCAAEYSGTATATITGLSYLEGETVGVISNGKYVGTKVVSSGSITLDATTTHAWVGLPYTSTLKTINIEHANPPGTSQGAKRRIVHAIARLVNTVGGKVGFNASDADDIEYDDEGNPNVSTPELFTGDTNPVLITTSSGRPQYLTLVQDEPYPFSVSAVVLRMEVQN